jgi:hypothetical protein
MRWIERRTAMENGKQKGTVAVRGEPRELLWSREIDRFLERAWIPATAIRRWRRPWMPEEWMPDINVFEPEEVTVPKPAAAELKPVQIQVK